MPAMYWLMRRMATSVRDVNRLNASSTCPGVVFASTTKKLDVRRASTFPIPASSMPVTVSSSPMTARREPICTALPASLPPLDFCRSTGGIVARTPRERGEGCTTRQRGETPRVARRVDTWRARTLLATDFCHPSTQLAHPDTAHCVRPDAAIAYVQGSSRSLSLCACLQMFA